MLSLFLYYSQLSCSEQLLMYLWWYKQKCRFFPHHLHWRGSLCRLSGQEKQSQQLHTISCTLGADHIVLTWTWKIGNLSFKCHGPKMRKLKTTIRKALLDILHAPMWLAQNSALGWCYQRLHEINQNECKHIESEAMYCFYSGSWITFNTDESLQGSVCLLLHWVTRRDVWI